MRTFQKTLVIIGTLIVDVPILVGSFWLGYKLVMGLQSPPQHIRAFIFDKFMGPFLLFFFIPALIVGITYVIIRVVLNGDERLP